MKKLIYLEDAIDALEKWESELTWDKWCYDHKDEAEKYNIISPSSVVFNLPPAQQWIPCSERPPEEDEQVFVYLFDDSPYIAWICGGRWHTEEFTLDKDEEPVAWMPLPAQYEGGRKE